MGIGRALIIAVSGFMIVFLMLCLLWFIIVVINKVTTSLEKKSEGAKPVRASAAKTETPDKPEPAVQGTFGGEIALYDVDEKTAACIMAIVSDETRIPLNQLIFKSIRALNE